MKKICTQGLVTIMFMSVTSLVSFSPNNNVEELIITDLAGDQVALPNKINTIATTSNSSTNMIIAFGGGDKLLDDKNDK